MTNLFSARSGCCGAFVALAALLTGCSFNGTYPDYSGADAAKLRFISNVDNTTLDVFDAEHCDGQTTGLLNNLFAANTKRRANMIVAPPAGTKAYLEIQLKPGQDLLLRVNTVGSVTVCTNAFNLTPQAGAEYELTFEHVGRQCRSMLSRLHQVNGQVVRPPVPLVAKGLAGCAGSNAIFPAAIAAKGPTAERTALIAQIVDESVTQQMKTSAEQKHEPAPAKALDKAVEDRKRLVGITLPDAYWAEYRQNLTIFAGAVGATEARSLQLYKDQYRARLERAETTELKKLASDSSTVDLSKLLTVNNEMMEFYNRTVRDEIKQRMIENLARMADLDRRYSVCERFAGCWQN